MKQKLYYWNLVLVAVLSLGMAACKGNQPVDGSEPEKSEFDKQMDRAMALAKQFGPTTQALAEETADEFDGAVTPLNYKSRESAERKCKTEQCMPLDLKDLARTTVVAAWDSADVNMVIEFLITIAKEDDVFGRYKHQTSDYGYWGDIVNLMFVDQSDTLMTEIQVKTYGMVYAVDPEDVVRATIGDEYYNYIRDYTGLEPGLGHTYYEIMRADTTSATTNANYQQLSIEYYSHFKNIPEPESER